MVQKYQNEIPPIFYYGISTKTSEKDLKIPNLQALTLGRIIKMTLYDTVAQTSIVKQVQKYWIKPTVKVSTYHMSHSTPRCGEGGGQLRWLFDP